MSILGLISIFSMIPKILNTGGEVIDAVNGVRDGIDHMLQTERDPTDDELNAIIDRLRNRSDRIQSS